MLNRVTEKKRFHDCWIIQKIKREQEEKSTFQKNGNIKHCSGVKWEWMVGIVGICEIVCVPKIINLLNKLFFVVFFILYQIYHLCVCLYLFTTLDRHGSTHLTYRLVLFLTSTNLSLNLLRTHFFLLSRSVNVFVVLHDSLNCRFSGLGQV